MQSPQIARIIILIINFFGKYASHLQISDLCVYVIGMRLLRDCLMAKRNGDLVFVLRRKLEGF